MALRLIRRTVNDGWGGSIASRNGMVGNKLGTILAFRLILPFILPFEARSRLYKQ